MSDYVFEVTTNKKYYPFLQELTYIRPLRMLSPNKFVGGATSDPYSSNSCPVGWGTITGNAGPTIECKGTTGISGTGRWEYVETQSDPDGNVERVIFKRNDNHWDASPDSADFVHLVHYDSHDDVKAALLDGTLDAVVGEGVLDPDDVQIFEAERMETVPRVHHGTYENRIVVLNTENRRRTTLISANMIHAVNKAAIIEKELAGIDEPADALFPKMHPTATSTSRLAGTTILGAAFELQRSTSRRSRPRRWQFRNYRSDRGSGHLGVLVAFSSAYLCT